MTDLLKELEAVIDAVNDLRADLTRKNSAPMSDTELKMAHFIRTHHAEIAEAVRDARRYREQMSKHYIRHPHQLIDVVRYANQFRPDWWMDKESWDSGIDFAIDAHNSAREVGE